MPQFAEGRMVMQACLEKQLDAESLLDGDANGAGSILRVCFVCTGNTCRSPMAAAVANAMAKQSEPLQKTVAFSAGLYANDGEPISLHAQEALEAAGVLPVPDRDYRNHRAHTLSDADVDSADLLVGMSGGHCMELLMRYPQAAQKITVMPTPISDPFGGDLAVYTQCLAEITDGVKTLLFSSVDGTHGEVVR